LPVACLAQLVAEGAVGPDDLVLCLLTASGVKWPETVGLGLSDPAPIAGTLAALEQRLTELALL
jgi:threonine synthase